MTFLIFALAILAFSAFGSLASRDSPAAATAIGMCGSISGGLLATGAALASLARGQTAAFALPWPIPGGNFLLEIDPLSAVFILPTGILGTVAAIYGKSYLGSPRAKKNASWFFLDLLIASMLLVATARNALLFLIAWEVMALTSYFLVTLDRERKEAQAAGWVYLVSTHLATAFLLVLFACLSGRAGSPDFDAWTLPPRGADWLFIFAVIGFGVKAGIIPLHFWLPEAHSAAPSHISPFMSGAMIKMGIYGLLRILPFLGPPPPWWGWLLIFLGLLTGAIGVIYAIAQHDLKRLLAYSSIENMGIIVTGVGLGVLGVSLDQPAVAAIGFAGALLHVWNHSLMKGLLFLGAGSLYHATGTLRIDKLGGLIKKMPWTGAAFAVGAAAIAGLPPFNGFSGEFLIYLASFHGLTETKLLILPYIGILTGLALIGGLAAAAFVKAFGLTFLGEPRSTEPAKARESDKTTRGCLAFLAMACAVSGLAAPFLLEYGLHPVLKTLAGPLDLPLRQAADSLARVSLASLGFLIAAALAAAARSRLLSRRRVEKVPTWDCGYARPTPRMQYTGSSFVQPLTDYFSPILFANRCEEIPAAVFPARAFHSVEISDLLRNALFRSFYRALKHAARKLDALRFGATHIDILYLVVTLVILLLWKVG
jgi:formate hydrogenlyase subunit 3/multisubunit Na+/H+ antiporter MnhD subunit